MNLTSQISQKMKRLLFIPLVVFFACSEQKEAPSNNIEKPKETVVQSDTITEVETEVSEPKEEKLPSRLPETLYGFYVGEFKAELVKEEKAYSYQNRINISIDSVFGEEIYGHSVVAGNDRPFQGMIKKNNGGTYSVSAEEPGDDQYDGKFFFDIYPDQKSLKGSWTANDSKLAVTIRKYELKAAKFKYDPTLKMPEEISWEVVYDDKNLPQEWLDGEFLTGDAVVVNASTKLLTKEEVGNMYKGDLEIIRNAIYARHGYSFKNRKIRYIFDNFVDWYIPVTTDVRAELTELEMKNIALIKRYEEHAERYYDAYGR